MRFPVILALSALLTFSTAAKGNAFELVTGNNYFPYTDERLNGGGYATVLVKEIFKKMGSDANVSFMSWGDGYAATKTGKFLATFPYIKTAEREAEFLYAVELFVVRPSLFINFERAPGMTHLDDLKGKTLCVPKGWGVDGYLQPLTDSGALAINQTTNVIGCFQLLYDGKVDAISIDRRLGNSAARRVSDSRWTKVRQLGAKSNPNYMIIPLSNHNAATWAQRLSAAKAELDADGTTARLVEAYFEQYR